MCVAEAKVLLKGGTVWHVGGSYESAKKHYDELTKLITLIGAPAIGLTYKFYTPLKLLGHPEKILGPTAQILALEITRDQDIRGTTL
jgi:hypothetical protein